MLTFIKALVVAAAAFYAITVEMDEFFTFLTLIMHYHTDISISNNIALMFAIAATIFMMFKLAYTTIRYFFWHYVI